MMGTMHEVLTEAFCPQSHHTRRIQPHTSNCPSFFIISKWTNSTTPQRFSSSSCSEICCQSSSFSLARTHPVHRTRAGPSPGSGIRTQDDQHVLGQVRLFRISHSRSSLTTEQKKHVGAWPEHPRTVSLAPKSLASPTASTASSTQASNSSSSSKNREAQPADNE